MNQSSTISRAAAHVPAFFDSREEALEEVRKRKSEPREDNVLVFFERTAYGNWQVYSIPADFMVDSLADGPVPGSTFPGLPFQKERWAR